MCSLSLLWRALNRPAPCHPHPPPNQVWNTRIDTPEAVIGDGGDLEHVRHLLGKPRLVKAGEVVWMTDRTPHESLPLRAACDRQYVRLVTSDVSVWYSAHSTANPLGVVPGPEVAVLGFDKFAPDAAQQLARALAAQHGQQQQVTAIAVNSFVKGEISDSDCEGGGEDWLSAVKRCEGTDGTG
jgi:hypothetical protein